MKFPSHFSNRDWIDWGREQPNWVPATDSQAELFEKAALAWLSPPRPPEGASRTPAETTDIVAKLDTFAVQVGSYKDEAKPDTAKTQLKWSAFALVGGIVGKPLVVKLGIATVIAAEVASAGLLTCAAILAGGSVFKQTDIEQRNRRFQDVIGAVHTLRDSL